VQGFSTIPGRVLGHARRLVAVLLLAGRRPVALGALALLATSAMTVAATSNTPPDITTMTVSPSSTIYEGQTVTLSGAFTDPDAGDYHSVRIHWGGAPGTPAQQIQLQPGQHSFQVTHTYPDNFAAPTRIGVSIYDRQTPPGTDPNDNSEAAGKDVQSVPIQVLNMAPQFVESSIRMRTSATGLVIEGDVIDASPVDILQVSGAVGRDPVTEPMTCTMGPSARHFRCQYPLARTHTIYLSVQDDEGDGETYWTRNR
jgi:hypothetical protein